MEPGEPRTRRGWLRQTAPRPATHRGAEVWRADAEPGRPAERRGFAAGRAAGCTEGRAGAGAADWQSGTRAKVLAPDKALLPRTYETEQTFTEQTTTERVNWQIRGWIGYKSAP